MCCLHGSTSSSTFSKMTRYEWIQRDVVQILMFCICDGHRRWIDDVDAVLYGLRQRSATMVGPGEVIRHNGHLSIPPTSIFWPTSRFPPTSIFWRKNKSCMVGNSSVGIALKVPATLLWSDHTVNIALILLGSDVLIWPHCQVFTGLGFRYKVATTPQ